MENLKSTLTATEKEVVKSVVLGTGNHIPEKIDDEEYEELWGEVLGTEMQAMDRKPLTDRQREILQEEVKHYKDGVEGLAKNLHCHPDHIKAALGDKEAIKGLITSTIDNMQFISEVIDRYEKYAPALVTFDKIATNEDIAAWLKQVDKLVGKDIDDPLRQAATSLARLNEAQYPTFLACMEEYRKDPLLLSSVYFDKAEGGVQQHAKIDDVILRANELGIEFHPVGLKGDITVSDFDDGIEISEKTFQYASVENDDIIVYENLYDVFEFNKGYSLSELPETSQASVLDRLYDSFFAENDQMVVVYDKQEVPSYALGAIINGDLSGIEDPEDEQNIRDFMDKNAGYLYEIQPDSEGFTRNPAFGLPTDCETVFMVKPVTPKELLEQKKVGEQESVDRGESPVTLEGDKLEVGMKVIWNDPEAQYRDPDRIYTIDKINGEVISISDEHSEVEVGASELSVVKPQMKEKADTDQDKFLNYVIHGDRRYQIYQKLEARLNAFMKAFKVDIPLSSTLYSAEARSGRWSDLHQTASRAIESILRASGNGDEKLMNSTTADYVSDKAKNLAKGMMRAIYSDDEKAMILEQVQEKAVKLFGNNFEFDYWNEKEAGTKIDRIDLGSMPDTISIDKLEIKDGQLSLYSNDIASDVDLQSLDAAELAKVDAALDAVKTYLDLAAKEQELVSLVGKSQQFQLSEPMVINVDDFVAKDAIDRVSVKDDGTIELLGRRIDEQGASASFSLEGRDEYDLEDINKVLDAVKRDLNGKNSLSLLRSNIKEVVSSLNISEYGTLSIPENFQRRTPTGEMITHVSVSQDGTIMVPAMVSDLSQIDDVNTLRDIYQGVAAAALVQEIASKQAFQTDEYSIKVRFQEPFAMRDAYKEMRKVSSVSLSYANGDLIIYPSEPDGMTIAMGDADSMRLLLDKVRAEQPYVKVQEDQESVHVQAADDRVDIYHRVHGWTHDDPALLYNNTEVDVFFYDNKTNTVENIDNEAGIDAYENRDGFFLVRAEDYDEAYRQLAEHDQEQGFADSKSKLFATILEAQKDLGDEISIAPTEITENGSKNVITEILPDFESPFEDQNIIGGVSHSSDEDCIHNLALCLENINDAEALGKAVHEVHVKHLEQDTKQAIHDRIVTPSARRFTPEQVNTLNRYHQVAAPDKPAGEVFKELLHEVAQEPDVSRKPEKWVTDTAKELNDLAQGITREEQQQLKR